MPWSAVPPERPKSLAVRRRRASRHEERTRQTTLAKLLPQYIDSACTAWTALENRPRSPLSGLIQKRMGVRAGTPDLLVIYRGKPIFIELKSRGGRATKAQKKFREELLAGGADWWMCRTIRAVMLALQKSGVVFRRPWKPSSPPAAWEGPHVDPTQRLPSHPSVAARRREERLRYQERQRARKMMQQGEQLASLNGNQHYGNSSTITGGVAS